MGMRSAIKIELKQGLMLFRESIEKAREKIYYNTGLPLTLKPNGNPFTFDWIDCAYGIKNDRVSKRTPLPSKTITENCYLERK